MCIWPRTCHDAGGRRRRSVANCNLTQCRAGRMIVKLVVYLEIFINKLWSFNSHFWRNFLFRFFIYKNGMTFSILWTQINLQLSKVNFAICVVFWKWVSSTRWSYKWGTYFGDKIITTRWCSWVILSLIQSSSCNRRD